MKLPSLLACWVLVVQPTGGAFLVGQDGRVGDDALPFLPPCTDDVEYCASNVDESVAKEDSIHILHLFSDGNAGTIPWKRK